jgi:presenilin 1
MVPPVTLAMVLTSLATHYINTVEYAETASDSFTSSYQVYDTSGSSGAKALGQATVNALVICLVIGAMTFVIVACFYFRCMKLITGYMVLSSFVLLAVMGGTLFQVAIDKYRLDIDVFTYLFLLLNFAVTGVISIFYQSPNITPKFYAQVYAIATSVLLAWQLTHFSDLTGWALLLALGLYDLCAVLTPCGPLKALVGLMQSREAAGEGQMLPGLLYEAKLPVARLNPNARNNSVGGESNSGSEMPDRAAASPPPSPPPSSPPPSSASSSKQQVAPPSHPPPAQSAPLNVPFALARVLDLEITDTSIIPPPYPSQSYNVEQNLTMVACVRPPNRQYARTASEEDPSVVYYHVKDMDTKETNTYAVNQENGDCYEVERDSEYEEYDEDEGAIKLGLGDFIFYSVLVSKAALYSLTTAVICTIIIIAGLGVTLLLLSVYKMALPALPVSIFFGVAFYALGRWVILVFVESLLDGPGYV